jgi:hypothetical protein
LVLVKLAVGRPDWLEELLIVGKDVVDDEAVASDEGVGDAENDAVPVEEPEEEAVPDAVADAVTLLLGLGVADVDGLASWNTGLSATPTTLPGVVLVPRYAINAPDPTCAVTTLVSPAPEFSATAALRVKVSNATRTTYAGAAFVAAYKYVPAVSTHRLRTNDSPALRVMAPTRSLVATSILTMMEGEVYVAAYSVVPSVSSVSAPTLVSPLSARSVAVPARVRPAVATTPTAPVLWKPTNSCAPSESTVSVYAEDSPALGASAPTRVRVVVSTCTMVPLASPTNRAVPATAADCAVFSPLFSVTAPARDNVPKATFTTMAGDVEVAKKPCVAVAAAAARPVSPAASDTLATRLRLTSSTCTTAPADVPQ